MRVAWKPIATAPRDGTPIFAAVAVGDYWPSKVEWRHGHWCVADVADRDFAVLVEPTHWISLEEMAAALGEPAAPTEQAAA